MRACALFPLLLLAACNDDPGVNARNASVEEVGEQIRSAGADDKFIRAGKWVSTVTLEQIQAPGMPDEAVAQVKQVTNAQSYTTCLTKEEAERPREDFFTGADNQCRYEHFKMGGGKIDAKMHCSRGGAEQVMELDGSYSPDSYDMRMTTSMAGIPGAEETMAMTMRIEAKRVGECEAKPS